MRRIDVARWPRRPHFELFRGMDYPHVGVCAPVDITALRAYTQAQAMSTHLAIIYGLTQAANAQPPFRQRLHGDQVVEYSVVHPSVTVPTHDDLFSFCTLPWLQPFAAFVAQARPAMHRAASAVTLDDEGRDDLLFMSSLPWLAFTSISHPIHMHPTDAVPRLTWGQFTQNLGRWSMPLSVQVHHALMDGLHIGRYFEQVQALFAAPADLLGPAA